MRAPPPVEFTSALGRAWGIALALLVGATVAVPLAWSLPYMAAYSADGRAGMLGDAAVQSLVAAGATVALASAAFWRNRPRQAAVARTLRWDGQDWVLAGRGGIDQRGDAELTLDLGPWMLVRFVPCATGHAAWLPLTASTDPARWPALRGALWNWRGDRGDARP